jgi:hypothetical protein
LSASLGPLGDACELRIVLGGKEALASSCLLGELCLTDLGALLNQVMELSSLAVVLLGLIVPDSSRYELSCALNRLLSIISVSLTSHLQQIQLKDWPITLLNSILLIEESEILGSLADVVVVAALAY